MEVLFRKLSYTKVSFLSPVEPRVFPHLKGTKEKPLNSKEFKGFGGDKWNRTTDPLHVKQVL